MSRRAILVVSFLIVLAVAYVVIDLSANQVGAEVMLPLIALLGMLSLLGVVSGLIWVCGSFRILDSQEALGLPSGSVRAIITLSILIIFVTLSIFIFNSVNQPLAVSVNLDRKTLEIIPKDRIVSVQRRIVEDNGTSQELFDVTSISDTSSVAGDVAKQLISILGTILAAVVSFYLGSRVALSNVEKLLEARGLGEADENGSILPDQKFVAAVNQNDPLI